MTEAAAAGAPSAVRAPGLLERVARHAVLARLGALREGRVTLEENGETFMGGEAHAPRELSARLTVLSPRFFTRVAFGGGLGFADALLDEDASCDDLVALHRVFVRNVDAMDGVESGLARLGAPLARAAHILNRATRRGAARNVHAHYDLGNAFFALFLDPSMTHSCALFPRADATLEEAQEAKLDLVCRKLELSPRDHLLEIGTGWGSLAIHAARTYGCRVTTTTISKEQHAEAAKRVAEAGLGDRVTLLLRDYRDLTGSFDKLASIEMIEAVGAEYLPAFFEACARFLAPGGRMALQAITIPDHRWERYRRSVDFIQRDIFPGNALTSLAGMSAAWRERADLKLVHLEELGPHYERTLQIWRSRFLARLSEVRALGYDEHFVRLWDLYLCYCEAGFAERYVGLLQMVLTR